MIARLGHIYAAGNAAVPPTPSELVLSSPVTT
jgi:hypothetical protein